MYAQPGKKLMFMGDEFGQVREWGHDTSLEWDVLQYPVHSGLQNWVAQLNRVYRSEPALHVLDNNSAGFEWVDCNDNLTSTISLLRKSESPKDTVLIVCNFTPIPRLGYRVGVPEGGYWAQPPQQRRLEIQRHQNSHPRRTSCRTRTSPRPPLVAEADAPAARS